MSNLKLSDFWGSLHITINKSEEEATIYNTWPILIVVVVLLSIHFLIYRKASYIEIDDKEIKVESVDGINEYKLNDIEKIQQIQFVRPPLYRLKIKNYKKSYLFVIYDFYIEFGGFVKDLSDKKKTLDKIQKENIA